MIIFFFHFLNFGKDFRQLHLGLDVIDIRGMMGFDNRLLQVTHEACQKQENLLIIKTESLEISHFWTFQGIPVNVSKSMTIIPSNWSVYFDLIKKYILNYTLPNELFIDKHEIIIFFFTSSILEKGSDSTLLRLGLDGIDIGSTMGFGNWLACYTWSMPKRTKFAYYKNKVYKKYRIFEHFMEFVLARLPRVWL